MPEETPVEPTEGAQEGAQGSTIDSLEVALKEIEKLRRENAAKRVKANEVEANAKKWEEHVQSQKTELERLTESKLQAEAEAARLRVDNLRNKVAIETKLNPELLEFLVGDNEDELRAKAKKLVETVGDKGTTPDFYAGQRGTPVPPKPATTQDWFAEFWKSKS